MSPLSFRIVKVLVASPSDVAAERKIAKEVINEWNNNNAEERRVTLLPILWEKDAAPECGDRPQGILNEQIVDPCHFAVGIFWTRIGTDTGVAPGGAVEEVERMMSMGKQVMLYFSNAPLSRKEVNKEQEAKLDDFRKLIQKRALCEEYETPPDFRQKFTSQLDRQVRRWFCQPEPVSKSISSEQEKRDVKNNADLHRYHSTLKVQLGNINLSGSPAIESFSVRLKDTFVSLNLSGTSRCETRLHGGDTWSEGQPEEAASTPEGVMSFVFQQHPLLLIIGDPGSGKTTLLKYYALSCLDNNRYKEFGFREPVNVYFLPLRELNKSDSGYSSLQAALSVWSEKHFLKIEESIFSGWLEEPSILVLLDGLDEISDVHDRIAVCDWIDRTVSRFAHARFVVTSRSTGYRKGDGIELDASHLRADIMDFTRKQQAEFLHLWFKAAFFREIPLGAGEESDLRVQHEQRAIQQATKKADAILAFLGQDNNKSLRVLAGIPLLLQIMAMLWKEREFLPGGRSELYDAALNYMLDYRDRRRGIYPLLAAKDARRVLSPVSLWMQEELKKDEVGKADMQLKMQELLDTLYNSLPAEAFCKNLVERAGVLVEYGEKEYVFRHKSFREYLAGVQLVKNLHRQGYLKTIVSRFGDDWWQEPLRFFIGHVEDAEVFDDFMKELFDSSVTENLTQKQQDLLVTLVEEAPQRKTEALKKKLLDPETTLNRQRYLVECLNTIGKPEALGVVEQFRCSGLSKEQGIHANVLLDSLEAEYILIKGGAFMYSLAQKIISVPDLYVAKYPVTNKLYRLFISYLSSQATEYEARLPLSTFRNAITDIGRRNLWDDGFCNYIEGEKQDIASLFRSLKDEDRKFGGDDQPVVSITWYAAKAYCLWLSLLESKGRNAGLYHLPTEMEWEYATAGSEGRQYPWGNLEPTNKLANYNEHEGATTPVGRYPDGATQEGLYDMAGNVWEWTEDLYDENASEEYIKSARALRGGSWVNNPDFLRCSARDSVVPALRYYDFGFRVVRSSHSS